MSVNCIKLIVVISASELNKLLLQPESATLDFKRQMYDFAGNADRANASLVKDVCAMVNTIRNKTAYIIFGVNATPGNSPVPVGLSSPPDEAILQDKVKTKVSPRAEFHFYTVNMKGTALGVMEFPVRRYETPVVPTTPIKGLTAGTVYYRQGSTNTSANAQEVIRIYEWMRSLPSAHSEKLKQDELQEVLIIMQDHLTPLSSIISRLYAIGKKYQINNLTEFSELELKGIAEQFVENGDAIKYRIQKVFLDIGGEVIINLNQFSSSEIKEAFRKEKHLIEADLHLGKSVNQMEMMLADFTENKGKRIAALNSSTHKVIPGFKGPDRLVKIYLFPDDLLATIRRIRTKGIELVMAEL